MHNIPPPLRKRDLLHPNYRHQVEIAAAGLNRRIAVSLTHAVATMTCAYIFVFLAFIGLLGIFGLIPPIFAVIIAWTSQTLIQLVMLSIIMVGQKEVGRHAELQSDASFHDIELILDHLKKQDEAILKTEQRIETLIELWQGKN